MKYKKTLISFALILSFYTYLFANAKKIETISTFPATKINIQDAVWHEKVKLNFEEINLKDDSGNNINGLYMTWTNSDMVYYFHWNGWPLNYFYDEIKYINDLWYWVFAYDYPWYWKSTWFPYKENVDKFSEQFFEYIKKEKNIKNENLIIWWYSVWTAVATDFASKNDFKKIVLVAPFSSRYEMWARYLFWFPPQKLFWLQNSYTTSKLVKNFKKPALIIHWNKDLIVPFKQWKKVFENYSWKEKYFIEIDSSWHNFILNNYWYALKNIISWFLKWEKLEFYELFLDENLKNKLENANKIADEEKEKEKAMKSLDFETDTSITKYVSNKISFQKLSYIPNDLTNIKSEYLIDSKWTQTLRYESFQNLEKMWKDFYLNFQTKLKIISAYRSYDYQVWIKASWCSDKLCAKAWFSEHQTGLAFDLFEATTEKEFLSKPNYKKYFDWLDENAYKYWFTNSYKNWIEIDWYENEPWHWRYVGVDFATYLYEKDLSFWKFMKNKQ